MQSAPITLVTGPSGSGKTTWIHEKLSEQNRAVYLALGSGIPVDERYLSVEFPQLQVLYESLIDPIAARILAYVSAGLKVYVEIGFHVDLDELYLPFEAGLCKRVAVVPSTFQDMDLKNWADEVVLGLEHYAPFTATQVWRSPLTGQIFDPASFDTFWEELTQGAYGAVHRVKGIFDLVDGRAFYFNYVAGLPNTQYVELNVPRWVEGRPERFSGIEVVGEDFDQTSIASTLSDCGLEDAAIAHYQAQIEASLEKPAEVSV
jgi:Cobalamin synthesis protein cobW C-terminal domain